MNLVLIVPLLSFVFNLFLFLAALSSKKTKHTRALIFLLGSFVMWTSGSLFMRLEMFPGSTFWYYVSSTGIFCVPFFIYHFFYHYTGRKGNAGVNFWLAVWTVLGLMNLFGLFVLNPQINMVNGLPVFTYGLSWLSVIPVVLAAVTIASAVKMVYKNIHYDGVSTSVYTPILIGILIMFVGIIVQSLFRVGVSGDTIFCCVNAICMYYALYKKRLINLTPIASNSPVYLMSIVVATVVGIVIYPQIDAFYSAELSKYSGQKVYVYALVFSILTIAAYAILRRLMDNLFVKGQEEQEQEFTKLSHEISKSLNIADMLNVFRDFLITNVEADVAYICLPDEEKKNFRVATSTREMQASTLTLAMDNPLVKWLTANDEGITYADFCKTKCYRSLWAKEKQELNALKIELIVPISCEGELMGITFFSGKRNGKSYSSSEILFLDSAAVIVAISFKNACLYMEMEKEARCDALTGLYNRGYFLRQVAEDFKVSKHDKFTLLMTSLDDFRLYNELYGAPEGDVILRVFAEILTKAVNGRGMVARYSGKEFVVSLPFHTVETAEKIASEARGLFSAYLGAEQQKTKKFITFSAGVCGYPTSASSIEEVITYANMALYSAKKNGKNRTTVYSYKPEAETGGTDEEARNKRQIAENSLSTILALTAAIDAKDHYTFKHSQNVSKYASILAEESHLDSEHVEIIRQAGLLHDIGKIGIPESILSKTGKLSDEEYQIMKNHVEGSISMIRHLPALDYVIPAAIGHHERWDGKGYPRGIKGEDIPIGARCLCIADTFDAMTTKRSYRDAVSVDEALEEIERNLGTQFDPLLGRKFIELVKKSVITVE